MMPATFMLAFAWNPVVGVPMLIVGAILLALIWLFGQPKKEQGKRRTEPSTQKGARREPVLGDRPTQSHEEPAADAGDGATPSATGSVTGPQQGELDMGLRAELERLGATLSGDGKTPHAAPPKAQPKLADHVASIIHALRAPPGAASTPPTAPAAEPSADAHRSEPSAATPSLPKSELGRRPAQVPVERIVTLFVVAREDTFFHGTDLVVAAEKAGLEYGDMGVYHRLVDGKRELGPIFSVANMLKPGSFDLTDLDRLRIPGVSFFMTLPAPLPALDAWDAMLPTAQRLAELMDGLVLDEERNALGRQCVAHIRDQLRHWDRDHEGKEIDFGD